MVRVTGFCNRDFPLTTEWGKASHHRCGADWCECTHHVRSKELVRMADVARANRWTDQARAALRLSKQLRMPVKVDHRLPEGTFIIGAIDLGSRLIDAHEAAAEEWSLGPGTFPVSVEQVEPPTMRTLEQRAGDLARNVVRVEVTERLRLHVTRQP